MKIKHAQFLPRMKYDFQSGTMLEFFLMVEHELLPYESMKVSYCEECFVNSQNEREMK